MSDRSAECEVKLSISAQAKNTLTDGDVAAITHAGSVLSGKIRTGVSLDQANRVWYDERTLGSGATETLDLYTFAGLDIGGGAGNDGLGQALTMEEIVTIIVEADDDNAGRLEIEPGAVNGMNWLGSHTVSTGGALPAGGVFLKHNQAEAAFDQSATSKNAKFTANGGACTYRIWLIGRHDDDESSSSTSTSSSSKSSSSTSSLSSTSSISSQSELSSSSSSSLSSSSTSSASSSSTSSSSSS